MSQTNPKIAKAEDESRRKFLWQTLVGTTAALTAPQLILSGCGGEDTHGWVELKNPVPFPTNLSMTDQDGNPVKVEPKGTYLVNFMVARCLTACPMNLFPQVNKVLSQPGHDNVQAITITAWPDNDQQEDLQFAQTRATSGLSDSAKARWHFCRTNSVEEVNALANKIAPGWQSEQPTSKAAEDDALLNASNAHPTAQFLVQDGKVIGKINGLTKREEAPEENERIVKAIEYGLSKVNQRQL